jgi:membrane-bound serine protease (ClpP class)
MSKTLTLACCILFLFPVAVQAGNVARVTIDLPIGPVAAKLIEESVDRAFEEGMSALIIELDTPGGLDQSMRLICRKLLNADLPVIVYVAPSGARAASAGLFIAYAAHVAAMAPSTNIGAAHVVNMGGEMDSVMSEKVQNDAVAYITSIAKKRGRNIEWAKRAVLESVSIDAEDALDSNIVDILANGLQDLLDQLEGREVILGDVTDTLHLTEASITVYEMDWKDQFLSVITNPTIAFILFNIGWLGLLLELYNPGTLFPGIVGGICLILAFFAFQQLPISYAGLGLIVFAVILFILEVKIVSHGLLGIGGVIAMLLGSLLLIDSSAPWLQISLVVIVATVTTIAAFFLFMITFIMKAHKRKVTTGREGILGSEGEVRPGGMVFLQGELWRAECDEPLGKGDRIKVVAVENMKVKVEKIGRSV